MQHFCLPLWSIGGSFHLTAKQTTCRDIQHQILYSNSLDAAIAGIHCSGGVSNVAFALPANAPRNLYAAYVTNLTHAIITKRRLKRSARGCGGRA